ncbi:MAG: helix-turn-helix transcriptional regulator [Alphaproteobacteria bacterium]
MMITIEQIKAARALLDWTQEELAAAAGLSKPSINTLERRIANPKLDTMNAIEKALEKAGVAFTDGPGVKLQSSVLKTQIFEGDDALLRLCRDIFDTLAGTGKELLISGIVERKFRDQGKRILEEIERRIKHNIKTKLLSCEGDTNFIEPFHHYRWMKKEFFPVTPTYIYDNKYALFLWGPPKKVVLIENADIAESYRQQFYAHWETAKVPKRN